MKLMLITESKDVANEHGLIAELFEKGLERLHVRKPGYSKAQMIRYLQAIPEKYYRRVVLHSHHSLVFKMNLRGVHFTESHRGSFLFPLKFYFLSLLRKDIQLSTSFHKLDKLKKASRHFDYVFLSPVFESISKENHRPEFNLRKVYEALKFVKCKVIALGGIDKDRIGTCRETGFHGVGVLGTIWMNVEPVLEFNEIKKRCEQEAPFLA